MSLRVHTDQLLERMQAPSGALVIYTLPALVLLVGGILVLVFLLIMLSLFAGLQVQHTIPSANPFTAYEALLPGQSVASVIAYAHSTPEGYITCRSNDLFWNEQHLGEVLQLVYGVLSTSDPEIECVDALNDEVFRALILTIKAERVQQLQLVSSVLRQERLSLYWGTPDRIEISANREHFLLVWNRLTYSATAKVSAKGSIVEHIILTAKNWTD